METIPEILSAVLGHKVEQVDGGFLIKETGTHLISVHRMIYNWRVARTPKANPEGPDRAYCYYGNDLFTLLRAVGHAAEWDGADDTDPEGFDKNAMTGMYADGRYSA